MALFVHYGLRADSFVDPVIRIFETIERENPLAKKVVISQNQSIAKWISLAVAEKKGVCASVQHFLPEVYLKKFAADRLGIDTEGSVFEKRRLVWAVYGVLDAISSGTDPDLASIRGYMADSALKPFQLAGKVAYLFDQYSAYRPDLIESWKRGVPFDPSDRDEIWQFKLFRMLLESYPDSLTKYDFYKLFALRCQEKRGKSNSGERVILLDVSLDEYLFPLYQSLSGLVDVYIFSFYPSSEMLDRDSLNPVLNRFCKGERYFFEQTCGLFGNDLDAVPEGETRLSVLQQSVFHDEVSFPECKADGSFKIKACWSKMREVEELRSELVRLFRSDPTLSPEDVAVAAPDISEYAAELEAQFAGFDEIPLSLPLLRGSGVRETFLRLLDICGSNFERSRVLEIFENPSVLQRFGVKPESCRDLFELIGSSGVKWGIDEAHRERTGCAEVFQNTWKMGMNRLFASCVMPLTDDLDDFDGAIPVGDLTGEKAEDFAKFSLFFKALAELDSLCSQPRPISDWQKILQQYAVDTFFCDDDTSYRELKFVRESVAGLAAGEGIAPEMIPFEAVRDCLKRGLKRAQAYSSAVTGRVTFCSIRSLSMIPFKTIFLIGMSAEAFPREDHRLAFDLTRKGKQSLRSLRNDDLFMFLKALMTARESLVISYVGKSQNNFSGGGSLLPVSSAVSELCEYMTGKPSSLSELASVMPMNSWSFLPQGAGDHIEAHFEEKRYESETAEVSLDDLASFFKDPAKWYLTKRAGIVLPKLDEPEDDDEMFDFDHLAKWKFTDDYLHELSEDEILRRARLTGKIPFGEYGTGQISSELVGLSGHLEAAEAVRSWGASEPLYFDRTFDIGGRKLRLYGRIDSIYENGLLYITASKCKSLKHKFKPLIYAYALGYEKGDWRLAVVSPDASTDDLPGVLLKSSDCPDYRSHLRTMLEIYCDALDELPFFSPKTVEMAGNKNINIDDDKLERAVYEYVSAGSDGGQFDFSSEYSQFISDHWGFFAPLFDEARLVKTCGYSKELAEIVKVLVVSKKTKTKKK